MWYDNVPGEHGVYTEMKKRKNIIISISNVSWCLKYDKTRYIKYKLTQQSDIWFYSNAID